MTPCIMLACADRTTRRQAQAALMDAGGRIGFNWRRDALGPYGAIFSVATAPDEEKDEIQRILRGYLRAAEGWMLSDWRQPFSEEAVQTVEGWFVSRPSGRDRHG